MQVLPRIFVLLVLMNVLLLLLALGPASASTFRTQNPNLLQRTIKATWRTKVPFVLFRDITHDRNAEALRATLDIRGGSQTTQKTKKCMKYTKIGLVNLAAKEVTDTESDIDIGNGNSNKLTTEDTTNGDTMVGFIVDEWIQTQYQEGGEGDDQASVVGLGNIVTFPPKKSNLEDGDDNSYEFSQGSFFEANRSDGKNNDIGNVLETMGALADTIIILYDTSNPLRHKAMVRLIKGIERQRETSSDKREVDVVILAEGEMANRELTAILDVLRADDLGETIQIIPVTKKSQENKEYIPIVHNALTKALELNANRDSDVPMSIFPRLVGRVYSRLCGKGTDSTVLFDTISVKRDINNERLQDENANYEPTFDENKDDEEFDIEAENETVPPQEESVGKDEKSLDINDVNLDEGDKAPEIETGPNKVSEKELGPNKASKVETGLDKVSEIETGPNKVSEVETDLNKALIKMADQRAEEILADSDKRLAKLEMKQDEVLPDLDTKMPILEFGRDANEVLKNVKMAFDDNKIRKHVNGAVDSEYVDLKCREVLVQVNVHVHRLFELQLQSLREYYGRRYESVIEGFQDDDDDADLDQETLKQRRMKRDEILAEEAKRATEGFRTAASNAIPSILRQGELKDFSVSYRYEAALDGLIRDMMHATSSLQSLEDEWDSVNNEADEDDIDENLPTMGRKGPVKWYEKLGARVLVFAVNYLQGWLAYQGIRKAAAERDRMMPKFPLF